MYTLDKYELDHQQMMYILQSQCIVTSLHTHINYWYMTAVILSWNQKLHIQKEK